MKSTQVGRQLLHELASTKVVQGESKRVPESATNNRDAKHDQDLGKIVKDKLANDKEIN
jgi:hypothetical protein